MEKVNFFSFSVFDEMHTKFYVTKIKRFRLGPSEPSGE